MKYLIVIEPTEADFSSYSPDLPGCIASAGTREECESEMRQAIYFHLEGLRGDGEPIPAASTSAAFVEVG